MKDMCRGKDLVMKGFTLKQNVELKEIEPFINSLGADKWLWGEPPKPILGAEFIIGIKTTDEELAGIGGVTKTYGIVPTLFIVVGPQFRGSGLGTEIMANILDFARQSCTFLILSVLEDEDHISARHLYRKNGFNPFYSEGNRCLMCISFNRRGEIICKLLPLVYFVFHWINRLLPLAHIFDYINNKHFISRQYRRNYPQG